MTKQIQDYPELDKWLDDTAINGSECSSYDYFVWHESVATKLLSMQSRIDSLTEEAEKSDWLAKKVVELTEQNKELQEHNLSDVKRAFWWSAEFTHVVHDGKINNAWIDFSENQLLNKESK